MAQQMILWVAAVSRLLLMYSLVVMLKEEVGMHLLKQLKV